MCAENGHRKRVWNYDEPGHCHDFAFSCYRRTPYEDWTDPGQDACTGWQAASGTRRDGKAPSHFEIAGDDRVFHPATAVIEGNELIVSSDTVAAPKAVRYAFTSGAMPNLMNREGLPASPFRTDTW